MSMHQLEFETKSLMPPTEFSRRQRLRAWFQQKGAA